MVSTFSLVLSQISLNQDFCLYLVVSNKIDFLSLAVWKLQKFFLKKSLTKRKYHVKQAYQ